MSTAERTTEFVFIQDTERLFADNRITVLRAQLFANPTAEEKNAAAQVMCAAWRAALRNASRHKIRARVKEKLIAQARINIVKFRYVVVRLNAVSTKKTDFRAADNLVNREIFSRESNNFFRRNYSVAISVNFFCKAF